MAADPAPLDPASEPVPALVPGTVPDLVSAVARVPASAAPRTAAGALTLLDGPMRVVTHASKYPLLTVTVLGAAFAAWRGRSWRPLLLVGGTGGCPSP